MRKMHCRLPNILPHFVAKVQSQTLRPDRTPCSFPIVEFLHLLQMNALQVKEFEAMKEKARAEELQIAETKMVMHQVRGLGGK